MQLLRVRGLGSGVALGGCSWRRSFLRFWVPRQVSWPPISSSPESGLRGRSRTAVVSAFVAVAARADRPRPARTRGRLAARPPREDAVLRSRVARVPWEVPVLSSRRSSSRASWMPAPFPETRRRTGPTTYLLLFPCLHRRRRRHRSPPRRPARRRVARSRHTRRVEGRLSRGTPPRGQRAARRRAHHRLRGRLWDIPVRRDHRLLLQVDDGGSLAPVGRQRRSRNDQLRSGDAAVPVPHHEGVFAHRRSKDLDEQLGRLRRGRVAFVRTCVLGRPLRLAAAVGAHGLPAGSRQELPVLLVGPRRLRSRTSSRFAASHPGASHWRGARVSERGPLPTDSRNRR